MAKCFSLATLSLLTVLQFACVAVPVPADDVSPDSDTAQDVSNATSALTPSGTNCAVTKDANGFFTRNSTQSPYVVYIPAKYTHYAPMRLIVGLHGCGDTPENFASWGINPWKTRATQTHIGISIGGETGGNKCWNVSGADDAKIAAAIEDLKHCYWIDERKVVIAGYSSGGQLAYRMGMLDSGRFAGIVIENSGFYAAGDKNTLLWTSQWRLNIAHRAHTGDTVFPLSRVRADWDILRAWKFPLTTSEVAGTHSGTGDDWADWLIPTSANWTRPW